jgi:hypothetical protein
MIEAAASPGKWDDWDHAFDDLRTALSDGEKILRTPPDKRDRRRQKLLTDYFLANYHRVITKERAAELKFDDLRKELSKLDAALPPLSEALVIREEMPRRTTHLLQRGDYRSPGDTVEPGTPAVLHPLREQSSPSRLDLARWLIAPENDWLASEFVDNGWRLKQLHKLIVTSATYRQSSRIRPELLSKDPGNAVLARQARVRLPAELIRDGALAASSRSSQTSTHRTPTRRYVAGRNRQRRSRL